MSGFLQQNGELMFLCEILTLLFSLPSVKTGTKHMDSDPKVHHESLSDRLCSWLIRQRHYEFLPNCLASLEGGRHFPQDFLGPPTLSVLRDSGSFYPSPLDKTLPALPQQVLAL